MIAIVIAVPAGIIAATQQEHRRRQRVSLSRSSGLSMPDFWLAILLIIVFAANLQVDAGHRLRPHARELLALAEAPDLPAIAVGTGFSAIIARMIRSSMLEVLNADYMRVAASKG